MRIEQYFLMTDYSLWEVILNGDSSAPTRVVDGVLQLVAPTTAKQRLARKNELMARGTLLMAFPNKHQLKFNSHKDAKTLMEAIEKRFGGNTETKKVQKTLLKQQYENFSSSSTESLDQIHDRLQKLISTTTQNIAFVSSSNTDSTNEPVSAAASVSAVNAKMNVSPFLNVDSLSNAMIYSFFASQYSSPQFDNNDLKEIDADDLEEMDLKWKMAMKRHFARECRSPKDSKRNGAAEPQRGNVPVETSTSNALVSQFSCSKAYTKAYAQLQSHFDKLTADFRKSQFGVISYQTGLESVEARLLVYKQNESVFEEDIKLLKLKVQLRDNALVSLRQTLEKAEQERDDLKLKPSVQHVETSIPAVTPKLASPKPTSNGKRRNRKACFVCKSLDNLIKNCDYHENKMAQPTARNHAHRGNHKQYAPMRHQNPQRHMVPTAILTQSKQVFITVVRPVSTVVPKISVTRARHAKTIVTNTNLPTRRHINCSPSPKVNNSPRRVTAVKAPVGNPQHALKDKGVIDSGCSRHMKGNISYLYDFEELNGRYVAFRGNPKGGKISGKGTTRTGKLDFDDVYFVKELKFNLFSVSQISTNPHNTVGDAAFDEKEPEFNEKKPESEVNVSPSTKFEDFFDNSINEVNAAGTLVPTIRQISPNSTNTFSVVGPSNAAASPTHRKSSCIDASQLLDDLEMPELEDITYSDNEDDVGAEADFNNLETSIIVSPIPTTRVHKDHHVTQIIGDLSLATQTRSMTGVAKDQGRLSQMFNDDFHTCMFACFLSQEETKRVHQALKDPSWIKAMQEELLQIKMQKVWVLIDLLYGKRAIGTKWVFRNKKDERGVVEEVYVFQPPGFENPDHPNKVYKAVKDLCKSFEKLMKDKFQMSSMGELTFFVASTPIDTEKPLLKDPNGEDVDVHTYISMIGSLMYLTLSRPDIMFAVCACARFQVTPKASHLHAVTRIFRYLKGKPHLGLWYPKDSPFDLVAYSDSDYAGASLDRKSTTRGCQFLRCRLISWQCKKQIVMATSSTEAKNVAATSCCAQVLWIQNQVLDYGHILLDCIFLGFGLTVQVVLSGLDSLKRMLHVTNLLSAGSLTSQQMVLNSPCLTHIKNWLVQIKRSQFWTTVALKKVNDVTRLQALVDKKKVVVTEATIRDALRLDDAEGVECLSNEEIFVELARMGFEKPSNKLTFYKAFFSSQVETPLFEGMLVAQEVGEGVADEVHDEGVQAVGVVTEGVICAADDVVPTADEEPSIPSPTPPNPHHNHLIISLPLPKVKHLEQDKIAQALEITKLKQRVKKLDRRNKVKVLKLRRLQDVRTAQRIDTYDDTVMNLSNQERMIVDIDADADVVLEEAKEVDADAKDGKDDYVQEESKPVELHEVVDIITAAKIITEVVTVASKTITTAEVPFPAATTTVALTLTVAPSKRTKGVVIRDPEESTTTTSTIVDSKAKSKDKGKGILVEEPKPLKKQAQIEQDEKYAKELEAELNRNIDWDEVIDHVKKKAKEDPAMKRYQALKRKPQTEAQAKKNMMIYLKNVVGFKMDYFKGMYYDDIRPIFEAKFDSNVAFLQKIKEQIDEEESRALKRINETPAEKAAKRKKLDEEVEELKRHFQIVPNKEDDVYTKATPLAHKVPVVDYEINNQNNKPYYKIKRAGDSHQL
nr:hypothetical protein [Tanacetum cinerariifolium]